MVIPNQLLHYDAERGIEIAIKREDLIHPFVSGNKYRKLKYNLIQATALGHNSLLTFGGAYSNHIAAVAFAGKEQRFRTIGIIRGDELGGQVASNPTLQFAKDCGMELLFVTREQYRLKQDPDFQQQLSAQFGDFYLIPEGGTNRLAVKGCEEILTETDAQFDYICCAVGTGGTIAGIINSALPQQKVLGFPALRGGFLNNEICNFAPEGNWELINDYHFGGYAKVTADLIEFINKCYKNSKIPLDPVYTAKMAFGVIDLLEKGFFPKNSKILLIHTGGIQGIKGMNLRLQNKQQPTIEINV